MSAVPRILIIGAGPCGLGCARELMSLDHENRLVFERASVAGGYAGSVVDPQGFRWDFGGHVVFSHYGEFDRLLEEIMGEDVSVTSARRTSASKTDGFPIRFRTIFVIFPPSLHTNACWG